MAPRIIRFALSIDEQLLEKFDAKYKIAGYQSRSEAIRALMRDYLEHT